MKKTVFITVAAIAGTLLLSSVTFAATTSGQSGQGGGYAGHPGFRGGPGPAMPPGIFGTVTAVNGDTLTVQSGYFNPGGPMMPATTTPVTHATSTVYTVNATNATVMKNGTSSTVGAIAVNDTVMVQGTVSGTNVTATKIIDGVVPGQGGRGPGMFRGRMGNGSSTSSTWNNSSTWPTGVRPTGTALAMLQGNGEPIVGGTVTAINGDMFTVTNASNVTYSIDGTNATVLKGNATSSVSSVAVNDRVIVQGTVNGTAVTASSIIDQGAAPSGNATSTPAHGGAMGGIGGFFGGIGSFFHSLFGFF